MNGNGGCGSDLQLQESKLDLVYLLLSVYDFLKDITSHSLRPEAQPRRPYPSRRLRPQHKSTSFLSISRGHPTLRRDPASNSPRPKPGQTHSRSPSNLHNLNNPSNSRIGPTPQGRPSPLHSSPRRLSVGIQVGLSPRTTPQQDCTRTTMPLMRYTRCSRA